MGLGVAIYLTYVKYSGGETVQDSAYAELSGVPKPVMGIIGNALILFSLLVPGERGRMLAALLALIGFGFSAYLTYLELFVIDALCQWCIINATAMTSIAVVATWRVVRA